MVRHLPDDIKRGGKVRNSPIAPQSALQVPGPRETLRSTTTTYAYDVLNRLTTKSYNDSPQTPTANFFYDQTPTTMPGWLNMNFSNLQGRLVLTCTKTPAGTCTNPATATAYSYDGAGRVSSFWQCTPSNCGASSIWNTQYTYDYAGDVTQWLHPAGFTVYTPVNHAQQVTSVSSSLTGANQPGTLASNLSYTPWGALSALQNGCAGTGCQNALETYVYNKRLQPYAIDVGTTGNPTAEYCKVYNYYSNSTWSVPTSCPTQSTTLPTGTTNNGNVNAFWYQDNSRPASGHTETYTYDSVNRLSAAVANPLSGGTFWSQNYSYGPYGNLDCTGTPQPPCYLMGYNGNNQLTSIGTSTLSYDLAGEPAAGLERRTLLPVGRGGPLGLD